MGEVTAYPLCLNCQYDVEHEAALPDPDCAGCKHLREVGIASATAARVGMVSREEVLRVLREMRDVRREMGTGSGVVGDAPAFDSNTLGKAIARVEAL